MRKLLSAILLLFLPVRLCAWLLNLMGHRISAGSKVGFSLIICNGTIVLEKGSRIGHFNSIRIDNLSLGNGAYIEKYNNLKGPFDLVLHTNAALGTRNKAYRAPLGVTYDKAVLSLGQLSKITANHRIDLTCSVRLGDFTTVAGHDTQLWTHGYVHDKSGPGRFRIDGEIVIGNNVYIGSRCIINLGVTIVDKVVVGAGACVSKSLERVGTYVNQPLRFIESAENEDARTKYQRLNQSGLEEEVYRKKTS